MLSALPFFVSCSFEQKVSEHSKDCSIASLQDEYRSERSSVEKAVRRHLARIDRLEPRYNAFIEVYREDAIRAAQRLDAGPRLPIGKPLWGVPIAVKGNIAVAGHVLTAGWAGYADPATRLLMMRDAIVVERLRAAGAIILGATNLPDMAASDTTKSTIAGRTRNAVDPRYSPGGSSGGSAVAVATCMVVAAVGTDTGNSIRNPASANGVVGFVPGKDFIPNDGVHPSNWLLDRVGPLAQSSDDAMTLTAVMAARTLPKNMAHLDGLRIGVVRMAIDGTPLRAPELSYRHLAAAPKTRLLFEKTLTRLRSAGVIVVDDPTILPETFLDLVDQVKVEAYAFDGVDRFLASYAPPNLSSIRHIQKRAYRAYPVSLFGTPSTQRRFTSDRARAADYDRPLARLIDEYRSTLKRHRLDALILPALQVPPNREDRQLPRDYPSDGPYSLDSWTNVVGAPSIVIPAGHYPNKLPFGIELIGDVGAEAQLGTIGPAVSVVLK